MFQHVCSYHRARVQDILVYIAKTPSPVCLHGYHERYKGWVHFCSRRLEILGPVFLLATYRNFSPEPPQLSAPSLVPDSEDSDQTDMATYCFYWTNLIIRFFP